MIVADTYLGRVSTLDCDPDATVRLDADERRRSRVRTTTECGTEVGVIVGRRLRTGDVIAGEDRRFLVEIDPIDALAIDLGAADPLATLELGHAIGNRHWDLAVEDGVAVVPIQESAARTRERIADVLPASASIERRAVSPAVFEDAGSGHGHAHTNGHRHTHEDGDGHGHEDGHGHTHDDGHGHTHTNAHGHAHEHDDGHEHAHDDGHGHAHDDGHEHTHDHGDAGQDCEAHSDHREEPS